MAQLVIKGHSTRGSEVIEILKMLGGRNADNYRGTDGGRFYFVNDFGEIDWFHEAATESEFIPFTLEEFLEKFPYKVGDKVFAFDNKWIVIDAIWDGSIEEVVYSIKSDTSGYTTTKLSNQLQPSKEETMGTITIDDFKANTKEWLIDKLHGMIISDAVKTISNIHDELHKLKYPNTYEECAILLNTYCGSIGGYNWKLLSYFQQLLICRDAYWKITGEQMGLDKPWEPDWLNAEQDKYVLFTHNNAICSNRYVLGHNILAFPTAEMRDAFYENFKELIEACKELL